MKPFKSLLITYQLKNAKDKACKIKLFLLADYIGKCYQELEAGKGRRISPYFVPRILPNLSAGHIRKVP